MAERANERLWNAISLDGLVQKAQELEKRLQSTREEALFRKLDLNCSTVATAKHYSFGNINGTTNDYTQLLADYQELASYANASQNEVARLRVELEAAHAELDNLKGYFNYCELTQRNTATDSHNETGSQRLEDEETAATINSRVTEDAAGHWQALNKPSNLQTSGSPGHYEDDTAETPLVKDDNASEPQPKCDTYDLALLKVFRYLTTKELCGVMAVCKQWQHVARDPTLWRRIEIKDAMIPVLSFYSMAKWCTKTEVIHLQGLIPTPTLHDEDLNSYVVRQKGCFEPALALILHSSSSTLKLITLDECNIMITQRVLWLISIHCPELNELHYSSDEFPPTVASLWCLSNGCPNITALHFPPVYASSMVMQFDDQCLAAIADGWPHIRSLSVGSPSVTSAGLHFIVKHCKSLHHLCVMYSQQVTEATAQTLCKSGLRNLRSLVVMFTRTSPAAVVYFILNCPQLKHFELHIGYSDYFSEDPSEETKLRYKMIIKDFKDLLQYPDVRKVFMLKTNYN